MALFVMVMVDSTLKDLLSMTGFGWKLIFSFN